MDKKDNIILAFESSCDETSVAVVKNGNEILSNIVATQVASHQRFGGVVPEVASRHHIEQITYCIQDALDEANVDYEDLDAVAVTYGPGLVGALLVGVAANQGLRTRLDKELTAFKDVELLKAPLKLCGDNAAMIGAAGYVAFKHGVRADMTLNAEPSLEFEWMVEK